MLLPLHDDESVSMFSTRHRRAMKAASSGLKPSLYV
jgi:hypothetical protein